MTGSSGAWADVIPGSDPPVMAIGCSPPEYVLAKQIPGCNHSKDDGFWKVPLSWPAFGALMTVFPPRPVYAADSELPAYIPGIHIYPGLQAWVAAAREQFAKRMADRTALDATDPEILSWLVGKELPGGPQLNGPQRGAVQYLLNWRRNILGDARGNGKTPPLIRAMQYLHEQESALPALVICPDSAPLSWQRKLGTWAPELRTVLITDSAAKRRSAIAKIAAGDADVGIIVWQNVRFHTRLAAYPGQAFVSCNKHGGSTGKSATACEQCEKEFNELAWGESGRGFRTVIPDEAHRLADPHSKQSRAVWWLMMHSENCWPTTGTLTPNSVKDLWAILHGLDPRAWPSRSKYLDLYALQDFAFAGKGKVILDLRPDTEATFHAVTMPYFRRIPREMARPGEPAMADPEFRYPPMAPRQKRVYDAIAKIGLAELEPGETLVPANSVVQFGRLCQLATATVATTDVEDAVGFSDQAVTMCAPSNKVDDLMDFLDNEPGQWIIGINSPACVRLSEAKLAEANIGWTKITGGMGHTEKDAAAQQFRSGQVRIIFITDAGGEAIDLPEAEGIFWMQPDPTFRGREQKTGRGDRFGRTTPFRQVWSLSAGTVDIRLYQLGLVKEARHEQITQDGTVLRWMIDVQPGETVPGDDHDRTPAA